MLRWPLSVEPRFRLSVMICWSLTPRFVFICQCSYQFFFVVCPLLKCSHHSYTLFLFQRVAKAIAEKSCNALLLKVNQIGSVTESIEAVKMSKKAGWGVMTSHRSGETEDTFIADLAVGLSTVSWNHCKHLTSNLMLYLLSDSHLDLSVYTGTNQNRCSLQIRASCQVQPGLTSQTTSKDFMFDNQSTLSNMCLVSQQLLRIEEELGSEAIYAGVNFRKPVEPY